MKSICRWLIFFFLVTVSAFAQQEVSEYPIHPECEKYKNRAEQQKCLMEKTAEHIGQNLNTEEVGKSNLPPGEYKIFVFFEIDSLGNVANIQARGPNRELEKEAIRVVSMLPQIEPAKDSKGNRINVKYALPITMIVEGKSFKKNKKVKNKTK